MIAALKPYPVYRDSRIEWLEKVPEHWKVRRLKTRVSNVVDPISSPISERLCLALENVESWTGEIRLPDNGVRLESQLKKFVAGDILFGKLRPYLAKVTRPDHDGACVGEFLVLRPRRSDVVGPYIELLLRSQRVIEEVSSSTFGAKMPRADWTFLGGMSIPLPPTVEQLAIVGFLDSTDRHISRYIRAKEKLLALLGEQKRALIHEAVTGRIDVRTGQPYPGYKDSGVEWLGNVPEHWKVVACRHLATKFGSGVTPRGGATVYKAKGIPLLRSQNVHFDGLRLEGVARITPDLHLALDGTHVKPRDVLLNITGASIGRVCTVPDDLRDANVNQHVCIIRPRTERFLPDYLAAFLSTPGMQEAIELEQVGASRQGLTLGSIRGFKMFVPPVLEQTIIVEAVHRDRDRFSSLASVTRRRIALLKEYRTRLIADVVTGKLDVREVAANLPETNPLARNGNRTETIPTELNLHPIEDDTAKVALP